MITVHTERLDSPATCDGCRAVGDDRTTVALARCSVMLCHPCRSDLHRLLTGGLTVGAALALPEVQRGEVLAESRDHGRVQVGVINQCVRVRCLLGGAWTEWETLDAYKPTLLTLPCRLVPLAAADADPATRGDL